MRKAIHLEVDMEIQGKRTINNEWQRESSASGL